MAVDEVKVKIEKFNGEDFGFWKMQIEDYLYQKKSAPTSLRGEAIIHEEGRMGYS